MEQQINPYEASQAPQQGHNDPSTNIPVNFGALGALIGTKFWVSLVGIVMLVIVAINLLVLFFANSQAPGGVFLVYILPLIMLAMQTLLAVRLVQYGKAIGRLKSGGTSDDFERAMVVQSQFWKIFGIICIVMISLMILAWVVAMMSIRSAF